ncbi:hypothetical protein CRG98_017813 [Punica granatum]|uniref:Uncharacterized protein n=1 Tax=Punica granatum TaxID=22663 RepID=A0A2I0K119_PUNGR|nr:hypothetical protein CRG98_017813 [Punica granatum]
MQSPSTTLTSRAITFKGFFITPTLPHEEVVTVQEPYHRAQPPFYRFSLYRVHSFLPNFLLSFRVCPGFGTFGTVHERLDLPLRSLRNPISLGTVTGASVPTPFSPSCHSRCLSDPNRGRRGRLDPCEPQKLSTILEGMWPRASLDYTSPRNPLSPRNGLVPVFLRFVIT